MFGDAVRRVTGAQWLIAGCLAVSAVVGERLLRVAFGVDWRAPTTGSGTPTMVMAGMALLLAALAIAIIVRPARAVVMLARGLAFALMLVLLLLVFFVVVVGGMEGGIGSRDLRPLALQVMVMLAAQVVILLAARRMNHGSAGVTHRSDGGSTTE